MEICLFVCYFEHTPTRTFKFPVYNVHTKTSIELVICFV